MIQPVKKVEKIFKQHDYTSPESNEWKNQQSPSKNTPSTSNPSDTKFESFQEVLERKIREEQVNFHSEEQSAPYEEPGKCLKLKRLPSSNEFNLGNRK